MTLTGRQGVRLAAALFLAVVVGGPLGACSDGGPEAGDRPARLPSASRGAPSAAATGGAAVSTEEGGDAAALLAPARPLEYQLRPGLPALPDAADAYRYVGGLEKDAVRRLAGALGMKGAVEETDGVMTVREGKAELLVEDFQPLVWSYVRDPEAGDRSASSSVSCSPGGDCPGAPPAPAVPGLPSAAAAEATARRLLEASGWDGEATVDVAGDGVTGRAADATPVVDGMAVPGLSLSIEFGAGGAVDLGEGSLVRIERVGNYDLVDLADAFARVQREAEEYPTGTAGAGTAGAGASDAAAAPVTEPARPAEDPTMTIEPPGATPMVPLQPEVVTLTSASVVLELVSGFCEDDPLLLVPSVAFAAGDDPGPVVDAVVDDQRLAAAPPEETEEPCPEGDGGGGVEPGKPEPVPVPEPAPDYGS